MGVCVIVHGTPGSEREVVKSSGDEGEDARVVEGWRAGYSRFVQADRGEGVIDAVAHEEFSESGE
jgi:hypothetical protein